MSFNKKMLAVIQRHWLTIPVQFKSAVNMINIVGYYFLNSYGLINKIWEYFPYNILILQLLREVNGNHNLF